MKILQKKLFRDLNEARGLLLAITSIMALGIMCYVTMNSAYQNLVAAKRSYYRKCRMADVWVDVKKVPVAELRTIQQIPGISRTRHRIQFNATVDIENVPRPVNSIVLSLPNTRSEILNDIILVQGSYFSKRRDNEVIINDQFARANSLQPGDWLHVLLNNRRQRLFVVGTAISSEFTYLLGPGSLLPDPERFGVLYLKQKFAEDTIDFQGAANQVLVELNAAGRANYGVIERVIETELEAYGVSATTPLSQQTSNQFLTNEINGLGAFANFLPTIFLAVAAVVLNVLMQRVARQQRTTIGTLKAIGYSDFDVFMHFIQLGVSVGIAGGIIGSVVGQLCSNGMTQVYRHYFEFPDLPNAFYIRVHCIGLLVSITFSLLGSIYGAMLILRLQPAAAMRPEPPRLGKKVWVERWKPLWDCLDSGWRMAIRAVIRNRVRTLASVFAAMMGAGLLVCGFMMLETQSYLINFQFHLLQRSDIDVAFEGYRDRSTISELARFPGVDYVEPQLLVSGTFSNGSYRRKVGIQGLGQQASLSTPRATDGTPLRIPAAGILITKRLAQILHARPGDALRFRPSEGEQQVVEMEIVQVADSFMGLMVYADIDYLANSIGEDDIVNAAQLLVTNRHEERKLLYHELKNTPAVQSVTLRTEMIERLTKTLLQNQFVFIGVLVGFAGVVFFGSIFNASIINLAERQREVATLLAIGYGPWQVGRTFLRESLIVTIVGTLLGIPLGHGLMHLTVLGFDTDLIRLPVVQRPWIPIVTFILANLFTAIAHAMVQWRIHKLDYLNALKVKE